MWIRKLILAISCRVGFLCNISKLSKLPGENEQYYNNFNFIDHISAYIQSYVHNYYTFMHKSYQFQSPYYFIFSDYLVIIQLTEKATYLSHIVPVKAI